MSNVDKYYPVQGVNKFRTVSFPITKEFRVDLANTTGAATYALFQVPAGAIVHGFAVRMASALETAGSGTVQFGFTGKAGQLTAATASGAATAGTILVPNSTAAGAPQLYITTAADTFDLIVATAAATGGIADVFLTYTPIPTEDLNTDDHLSYTPGA